MKRILNFFENLIYPPKCVGCGELFQKDIFDSCKLPLCEKCRVKWEYEKLDICPDCGLEMTLCECGSRLLDKLKVDGCIKLVNYSAAKRSVGKSAVLYMKRKNSKRAFGYFAKQLSYAVKRKLKEAECQTAVIAYVPRSRKSRVTYGFDQSREMAKRLAKLCGGEAVKLFLRNGKRTEEQKKLSLAQRLENAKGMYRLARCAQRKLEGADAVIIVDDVLTSGASLSGCVMALKDVYKKKIFCVTLARTGKSRKK